MVNLLIIADDFTGALDTGVQFSTCGISTRVVLDQHLPLCSDGKAQVLVIDAETRHLTNEQAYETVYQIVLESVKAGIPYLYKKTDSALRGNIGSELTAVLHASGADALAFIPAFPKMNRVTKNGIQYIDGVPVSQSVFGEDPFEPVKKDHVRDIILAQQEVAVTEISKSEREKGIQNTGILVFDASTDDDILDTGLFLKETGRCRLMAGCAGFAAILPELLGLKGNTVQKKALQPKLLVICGSVNPITRNQIAYGVSHGYQRIGLTPEQKLNPEWWESPDGMQAIRQIEQEIEKAPCCIIDSNDEQDCDNTVNYAATLQLSREDLRVRISQTLGVIGKKLLGEEPPATCLITGGDTLLGLMKQVGCMELTPICEIEPGTVLTYLRWNKKEYPIISKSGGFGEEDLLERVVNRLSN